MKSAKRIKNFETGIKLSDKELNDTRGGFFSFMMQMADDAFCEIERIVGRGRRRRRRGRDNGGNGGGDW